RFVIPGSKTQLIGGFLDDVRLTPDVRLNAIIVSAPKEAMDLMLALINQLDSPPYARASINIFTLKRADATTTAQAIQQLFLGTGTTGTTGQQQGAFPGQGPGQGQGP